MQRAIGVLWGEDVLLHHPLLVKEDTKTKSFSYRPTYLFWHIKSYFQPSLTSVYCYCSAAGIRLNFGGAGSPTYCNVSQLVLWGRAEGSHSEWLLPQPEIILMGTGVDREPGAHRAAKHRAAQNPLIASFSILRERSLIVGYFVVLAYNQRVHVIKLFYIKGLM